MRGNYYVFWYEVSTLSANTSGGCTRNPSTGRDFFRFAATAHAPFIDGSLNLNTAPRRNEKRKKVSKVSKVKYLGRKSNFPLYAFRPIG